MLSLVFAVGLGVLLRAWLLTHHPLTSDEAIAGLMATQIRQGHFYSLYWGQAYGGVEPYVVAFFSLLFGATVAVYATVSFLGTLAAIFVWRIVRRLVPPEFAWLGVVAACIYWVWPEAGLWNSTYEWGFRGVTMAAGLASLLFALRLIDDSSLVNCVLLGLSVGILWWSSPESVYFAVPLIGLLSIVVRLRSADGWPVKRVVKLVVPLIAGSVVGAFPWLWTNFHDGFASLKLSSSPTYVHSSYLGRLSVFFWKTLPIMLGVKLPLSGSWVGGPLGEVLFVTAGMILLTLCVRAVMRIADTGLLSKTSWCALGVVLFPFWYAVFPATSFWEQGQYGLYLLPLLLFVVCGSTTVRAGVDRSRRFFNSTGSFGNALDVRRGLGGVRQHIRILQRQLVRTFPLFALDANR